MNFLVQAERLCHGGLTSEVFPGLLASPVCLFSVLTMLTCFPCGTFTGSKTPCPFQKFSLVHYIHQMELSANSHLPGHLPDLTGIAHDLVSPPFQLFCTLSYLYLTVPCFCCICWCTYISYHTEFLEGRNQILPFYDQYLVHTRHFLKYVLNQ